MDEHSIFGLISLPQFVLIRLLILKIAQTRQLLPLDDWLFNSEATRTRLKNASVYKS